MVLIFIKLPLLTNVDTDDSCIAMLKHFLVELFCNITWLNSIINKRYLYFYCIFICILRCGFLNVIHHILFKLIRSLLLPIVADG